MPPTFRCTGLAGLLAMLALAGPACAAASPAGGPDGDPLAGLASRLAGLLDGHSPLILGEIHGTTEVPALVGAILAVQVASGRPVTLALEIPDSHQGALDAWLAGDGGEAAGRLLARHPFWSFEDGRSSAAMLELLDQVRRWRRDGADIRLLAFDVPDPSFAGARRERHMAGRIGEALAAPGAPPMLVLTGNLHARRAIGNPFDPGLELMAWHLRELPVLTLDLRANGGSAWICAPQCGVRDLAAPDRVPATGLRLFGQPSDLGYDGEVVLARFTASPPAFPTGGAGSTAADP